jgi:hypothetical protein
MNLIRYTILTNTYNFATLIFFKILKNTFSETYLSVSFTLPQVSIFLP